MKCKDCGYNNLEGEVFCVICGAKLSALLPSRSQPIPPLATETPPAEVEPVLVESVDCLSCRAKNSHSAGFCATCGARLPVKGEAETPVIAPAPAPKPPAEVVLEAANGVKFNLQESNILGRKSPEQGVFPEINLSQLDTGGFISRRHARIVLSEGDYLLEDLDSVNKTFVNDRELLPGEIIPLKPGDKIRLANLNFTFSPETRDGG